MAAIYDLAQALAQAQQPVAAPPPVSAAPVSPVAAAPALPAFDPTATAPAAPHDPNASGFSNWWNALGASNNQNKALAQFQGSLTKPGGVDQLTNFIGGNDATTAAQNTQARTFDFYHDPNTTKYLAAHPDFINAAATDPTGFAAKLQPVIDAAMKAPTTQVDHPLPDGTILSKKVPDPTHLAAVASITGEKHADANPFVNHSDYTDEDFINATQHLNWKQASRLFGAAQRLTPQQQLIPQYAGILHDNAAKAQADYDAAVQQKLPKGKIDAFDAARKAANTEALAFLRKMTEGSNVIYPDSAVTQ